MKINRDAARVRRNMHPLDSPRKVMEIIFLPSVKRKSQKQKAPRNNICMAWPAQLALTDCKPMVNPCNPPGDRLKKEQTRENSGNWRLPRLITQVINHISYERLGRNRPVPHLCSELTHHTESLPSEAPWVDQLELWAQNFRDLTWEIHQPSCFFLSNTQVENHVSFGSSG